MRFKFVKINRSHNNILNILIVYNYIYVCNLSRHILVKILVCDILKYYTYA